MQICGFLSVRFRFVSRRLNCRVKLEKGVPEFDALIPFYPVVYPIHMPKILEQAGGL